MLDIAEISTPNYLTFLYVPPAKHNGSADRTTVLGGQSGTRTCSADPAGFRASAVSLASLPLGLRHHLLNSQAD